VRRCSSLVLADLHGEFGATLHQAKLDLAPGQRARSRFCVQGIMRAFTSFSDETWLAVKAPKRPLSAATGARSSFSSCPSRQQPPHATRPSPASDRTPAGVAPYGPFDPAHRGAGKAREFRPVIEDAMPGRPRGGRRERCRQGPDTAARRRYRILTKSAIISQWDRPRGRDGGMRRRDEQRKAVWKRRSTSDRTHKRKRERAPTTMADHSYR